MSLENDFAKECPSLPASALALAPPCQLRLIEHTDIGKEKHFAHHLVQHQLQSRQGVGIQSASDTDLPCLI